MYVLNTEIILIDLIALILIADVINADIKNNITILKTNSQYLDGHFDWFFDCFFWN